MKMKLTDWKALVIYVLFSFFILLVMGASNAVTWSTNTDIKAGNCWLTYLGTLTITTNSAAYGGYF